jgi:hypothetical protein
MQARITERLRVARGVLDEGWGVYELSPDEARDDARDALIGQAIATGFPKHGMLLAPPDLALLADEADAARRNWMELLRLRVDGNGQTESSGPGTGTSGPGSGTATAAASSAAAPSTEAGTPAETSTAAGTATGTGTDLATWGANVAAQQADDWMTLLDRLRRNTRQYRIEDAAQVLSPAEHRSVRRFARRCAADLRIATPQLLWIRRVREDGDLVSLGDIAGCAIRQGDDEPLVYVNCDISDVLDRLRVVAHEVAHHGGADEDEARAYEQAAVDRHARR